MSYRRKVKASKDRKIFKKAADATKKMNITPKVNRGGIRL